MNDSDRQQAIERLEDLVERVHSARESCAETMKAGGDLDQFKSLQRLKREREGELIEASRKYANEYNDRLASELERSLDRVPDVQHEGRRRGRMVAAVRRCLVKNRNFIVRILDQARETLDALVRSMVLRR